jgi:transcriptional regulator GlxA family with amidase domain
LVAERQTGEELAGRVAILGLATAFFTGNIRENNYASGHGLLAPQRFRQLIASMPEGEFIHYSPEQLSRLCGCGTRHFNRLFHQQFGESPRARQTRLRLLKARNLLASSSAPVRQVALDCGYRSLSLFNSLFKKRFGLSPSEWREQESASRNGPAT